MTVKELRVFLDELPHRCDNATVIVQIHGEAGYSDSYKIIGVEDLRIDNVVMFDTNSPGH